MKKLTILLLAALLSSPALFAQDSVKHSFGISFIENDYLTAARIRSNGLAQVLNNKQGAKLNDMSPGIQLSYYRTLKPQIDFMGEMGFSFVNIKIPNKTSGATSDDFLAEAAASAQFKMLTDDYIINPYVNAGVGGSYYRNGFGAFIPLGVGIKLNIFQDGFVFISSQYRIPVTPETNTYHFVHGIGIAGRF